MHSHTTLPRHRLAALAGLILAAACGAAPRDEAAAHKTAATPSGHLMEARDSTITAVIEAAGIAEPIQRATMSTRLMGAVTEVPVQEGQRVRRGQLLARIDARELAAKRAQVTANVADAEAVLHDAKTQAQRFRSLYADSAATQAQLDAAETGLSRAEAGVGAARAAGRELDAMNAYAELRAPFAGIVTRRFVDPGSFVAPGAPVITLEDASRLRISVTVAPEVAAALKPGAHLRGTIEHRPAEAVLEGVAPSGSGAVYTVNALVANPRGEYPPGSAATLAIAQGTRSAVLVPISALVREGDLIGVRVQSPAGTELRWVRIGTEAGDLVEVLSGIRSGDSVLVPAAAEGGS